MAKAGCHQEMNMMMVPVYIFYYQVFDAEREISGAWIPQLVKSFVKKVLLSFLSILNTQKRERSTKKNGDNVKYMCCSVVICLFTNRRSKTQKVMKDNCCYTTMCRTIPKRVEIHLEISSSKRTKKYSVYSIICISNYAAVVYRLLTSCSLCASVDWSAQFLFLFFWKENCSISIEKYSTFLSFFLKSSYTLKNAFCFSKVLPTNLQMFPYVWWWWFFSVTFTISSSSSSWYHTGGSTLYNIYIFFTYITTICTVSINTRENRGKNILSIIFYNTFFFFKTLSKRQDSVFGKGVGFKCLSHEFHRSFVENGLSMNSALPSTGGQRPEVTYDVRLIVKGFGGNLKTPVLIWHTASSSSWNWFFGAACS